MTGLYVLCGAAVAASTALMTWGALALGYSWPWGLAVAAVFFGVTGTLGWALDARYEAKLESRDQRVS